MRHRRFETIVGPSSQKGSTLLVVLALLALLVLIAATMSVSIRMETTATQNFAQALLASTGVKAALPESLAYLDKATSVTHLLQPWANSRYVDAQGKLPPSSMSKSKGAAKADDRIPRFYDLTISDLSGRVNVNAVTSEQAFSRFLLALMPQEMANGVASRRARALLTYRGMWDKTQTTAALDLRVPPPPGFRRFESIAQLAADPATAPDLFSAEELKKLEPYLTVFSMAPEEYRLPDGQTVYKQPLEARAADAFYRIFREAFPEKEDRLLLQYAVNVADYLDEDNVPSVLIDSAHPEPWNRLIGIERTPVITEVYPDSLTRGTDGGQFVEIYNPWDEPISVQGWRLVVAGGTDGNWGTAMISLSGNIAPQGYIIVTDNYDQPPEGGEPGTGCFLAIFGRTADGYAKRIVQSAALDLPDKNSYVSLIDAQGNLIDIFSYTDRAKMDSRQSYQRPDPIMRAFVVADATPFALYTSSETPNIQNELHRINNLWKSRKANEEARLADLLLVPTSYIGLNGQGKKVKFAPHLLQKPVVVRGARMLRPQQVSDPTNLDARVLDLFTATGGSLGMSSNGGIPHSYGKLNINTCSDEAFLALDASDGESVDLMTPELVNIFTQYRQSSYRAGIPPFEKISDFVTEVFGKAPDENETRALSTLLDQICVGSLSFDIQAQTIQGKLSESGMHLPRVRMHWILGLDFRPCSVIHFTENSW